MPILKNQRWEKFAQELAQGKTADEAYQLAGYEENRGNATRLKANESVMKRIEELQAPAAERAEITAESLIREAHGLYLLGKQLEQVSAATGALKLTAELSGHYVARKEDVTPRSKTDILDRLRAIVTAEAPDRDGQPAGGPTAH